MLSHLKLATESKIINFEAEVISNKSKYCLLTHSKTKAEREREREGQGESRLFA